MLLLATAAAACQRGGAAYPYDREPDPRGSEYVIGVSDDLQISVWKNRDLDTKIAVRPDGNITMPLIGDVRAAGLTPNQLRGTIATRLSDYIREEDAIVTVSVTGVNSYYVTVAGSVGAPGRIASKSYLTVADAIALAGGPSRFASPGDTVLLRHGADGNVKRIPIDYAALLEGKRLEQNIVLLRGDRIYVP